MGKIIAVANQKGGVGKSHTVLNLASILGGEFNKKVLVIDFDQQLSTTINYNLNKTNTIMDIFNDDCKIKDAIQHTKYFDAIPGHEKMSTADRRYTETEDIFLLSDVCEVIRDIYDYIIIDNSPARNICLNMAYVAADYIIIPADATPDSLRGAISIHNDIEKLKSPRVNMSHAKIIGMILIAYEKSQVNDYSFEQLQNIANTIDKNIFVEKTRKTVKAKEATYAGKTLYEYSKYCNPIFDYKRIAQKIIELEA